MTGPRADTAQRLTNLIEDIEWLLSNGESACQIPLRLGTNRIALTTKLARAGRKDLSTLIEHA